jgi:hypothetical protein
MRVAAAGGQLDVTRIARVFAGVVEQIVDRLFDREQIDRYGRRSAGYLRPRAGTRGARRTPELARSRDWQRAMGVDTRLYEARCPARSWRSPPRRR